MQRIILFKKNVFYLITFYFGFSSTIAQVVLIRELLTIFRGNEFIIGVIFSAWFLGIFLGARYNPEAGSDILRIRLGLSLLLFPAITLVIVYLAHAVPLVFSITTGTFYSAGIEILLSILLTVPVSYFFGFTFPTIVSLVSAIDNERSGGNIYYLETAGAFCGGILFSFLLIDLFNPVGVISILIILSLLLYASLHQRYKILWLIIMPVIFLAFSGQAEKKIFKYIWNETHPGSLVEYKRTKYQTITVEKIGQGNAIYGDGVFYYTIPDRYQSRGLFHLIQSVRNKKNEEMLLLGSSPGSLVYNFLRSDISSLYYFEIDQKLWDIENKYRKKYYDTERDDRLKPVQKDIRNYFTESGKKFDLIVCLPPPPENAMLNRFYTVEFYSLCKENLTEGGIFITSMHGFSNYMSPVLSEFIASVYKGFIRYFPHHFYTSGETIYLIGAKGEDILPADYDSLIDEYKEKLSLVETGMYEEEITGGYNAEELRMFFEETQLDYFQEAVSSELHSVEMNSDLKPKAYWNKILLSAYQENSIVYGFLKRYHLLPLIVLIISFIIFWGTGKKYGRDNIIPGFLIFITGFTSISTVLLLIILYQNFYGIIFYRISLINALFMFGLAAGSYYSNRRHLLPLIRVFLLLIAALLLLIFYTLIRYEALFWVIIIVFSFLCGMIFPALFKNISNRRFHRTASMLDSLDHYGSIAGSFLTAIYLVPMFGISVTIYINISILFLGVILTKYAEK